MNVYLRGHGEELQNYLKNLARYKITYSSWGLINFILPFCLHPKKSSLELMMSFIHILNKNDELRLRDQLTTSYVLNSSLYSIESHLYY